MDMIPKELSPELPVVHVIAVEQTKHVTLGHYRCPMYVTTARGQANFVTTAWLKMESDEADDKKWILAGTCLVMQPE